MKYCKNCGQELPEEADFCSNCGAQCYYKVEPTHQPQSNANEGSTLKTLALVFMIIATVISGFAIIPLCWCIPMTVRYYRYTKGEGTLSTAFKVCTLLFVSLISGILMLVDED